MWLAFIRIAKIAKSKFKNRNVSRIENREIKDRKSFQKSERFKNRKSRNQKSKIVSKIKIETRFKNQKSKFTSGKIDIRAGRTWRSIETRLERKRKASETQAKRKTRGKRKRIVFLANASITRGEARLAANLACEQKYTVITQFGS